jgi:hypothetical protein
MTQPTQQPSYFLIEEKEMQVLKDAVWMLKNTKYEEHMRQGIIALAHTATHPHTPSPQKETYETSPENISYPEWMDKHDTHTRNTIRNATLDELQSKFLDAMNERSFADSDGDYFQCSQLSKDEIDMIIESLRGEP